MKHPPRDSWIRLSAGETLHLDPRLHKEWQERTHHFRFVRGTILTAAFQIEHTIDRIFSKVFVPIALPTLAADSERLAVLLSRFFLRSGVMSFDRKIRLLKEVASEIPALAKLMPAELVQKLNLVRERRSKFAHDPIVFSLKGDPPNQELLAVLVGDKNETLLDTAFLEDTGKLFASAEDEIQKLYDSMSETIEPTAPQPAPSP